HLASSSAEHPDELRPPPGRRKRRPVDVHRGASGAARGDHASRLHPRPPRRSHRSQSSLALRVGHGSSLVPEYAVFYRTTSFSTYFAIMSTSTFTRTPGS